MSLDWQHGKALAMVVTALIGWVLPVAPVHAQTGLAVCGDPFRNHYGPYDYRITSGAQRRIVEQVHFTPTVESLRGGATSQGPGGDLSYTLDVYPNHHRALMSMMRYAVRERASRPGSSTRTIECWFDRAERFRPDDGMVKLIHGLYLLELGRSGDAVLKLEAAREVAGENANVHYNLGLAYLDLKEFEKALSSAHIAYGKGFPLPGLRNRLERAGVWRNPAPE